MTALVTRRRGFDWVARGEGIEDNGMSGQMRFRGFPVKTIWTGSCLIRFLHFLREAHGNCPATPTNVSGSRSPSCFLYASRLHFGLVGGWVAASGLGFVVYWSLGFTYFFLFFILKWNGLHVLLFYLNFLRSMYFDWCYVWFKQVSSFYMQQ